MSCKFFFEPFARVFSAAFSYSIQKLSFSDVLQNRCSYLKISQCDSNVIRNHNHLVRKWTLNYLAKLAGLAKWLSVRLRTKWLWVRITLLSLKLQIWRLLRARSSLTFRQTIERGFTLKLVRDMIITYSEICRNIYRKTLVLGALFNKVAGVKACNFIKKRLQHRCFAMNIAKSLRTAFYRTALLVVSVYWCIK